jgi:hypothetical protein
MQEIVAYQSGIFNQQWNAITTLQTTVGSIQESVQKSAQAMDNIQESVQAIDNIQESVKTLERTTAAIEKNYQRFEKKLNVSLEANAALSLRNKLQFIKGFDVRITPVSRSFRQDHLPGIFGLFKTRFEDFKKRHNWHLLRNVTMNKTKQSNEIQIDLMTICFSPSDEFDPNQRIVSRSSTPMRSLTPVEEPKETTAEVKSRTVINISESEESEYEAAELESNSEAAELSESELPELPESEPVEEVQQNRIFDEANMLATIANRVYGNVHPNILVCFEVTTSPLAFADLTLPIKKETLNKHHSMKNLLTKITQLERILVFLMAYYDLTSVKNIVAGIIGAGYSEKEIQEAYKSCIKFFAPEKQFRVIFPLLSEIFDNNNFHIYA